MDRGSRVFVIDTHALYWYWTEPSRLGDQAALAFTELEARRAIGLVPTLVVAELLYIGKKQRASWTVARLLTIIDGSASLRVEAMTRRHLLALDQLSEIPEMHDRLIAAVGLVNSAEVISRDHDLQAHRRVRAIW